MEKKRQWLITRILHVTAQLSQCPDEHSKRDLHAALSVYTQALHDLEQEHKNRNYFS